MATGKFYIRGVKDGAVMNVGNPRAHPPSPMDKGGATRMMENYVKWYPGWSFSVEPWTGQTLTV